MKRNNINNIPTLLDLSFYQRCFSQNFT